ncbi:CPBP family intramembrane glutamic endopeptidase [Chitinophaga sp. RAB17]|uniref:CPBP family intramembrane glutamic endopeptidase n=1 Tax=Chitinophaga sp. RAB17 TaxID=3233049 RepID=UPI003F933AAD
MTPQKDKIRVGAIVTFYVIAIALRYATNKTSLLQYIPTGFLKIIIQGIGPAIAALIVFLAFRIKPTQTLWGNYSNKIVPVLLFWGLPFLAVGIITWIYKGTFNTVTFSILIYGLLEEMGWRGFLQPALSSLPKFANIFIVAVLWFIWHLNFELSSANLSFFLILLFSSWGLYAVADKTHSLIALSAFHAIYDIYSAADNKSPVLSVTLIAIFCIWIGYLVYTKKVITPVASKLYPH